MTHHHSHGHSHSHVHASQSRTRLAWALAVTLTIVVAELVGAWISGSLALAADAGHMIVDSSGLIVALIATQLMLKPRTDRHTWGWGRAEVIAAALQSGMLIIISGIVAWQAIRRLIVPEELIPIPMLVIGVIGLVANVISLLILSSDRNASLNMRAAFLEVLNDALGSVAVIIAAIIALTTGWVGADSVASLIIAAMMAPRAYVLLRGAIQILMEQTPPELDLADIRHHMLELSGVEDVHDLHISTIQTGVVALTAHLSVDEQMSTAERNRLLHELEDCTAEHFPLAINHTTFQFDSVRHQDHENLTH